MAGDLIPPPSPAGRADPDAERREAEERKRQAMALEVRGPDPAGAAAPEPPAAPRRSRYRSRFGFLTGALAGLAVAGLALAAILLTRDQTADQGLVWSAWQPISADRLVRATEIAQHVGHEYRLNDGSQLVEVEAGPLALNGMPLTPLVRTADPGGDIIPIYGNGLLYVLNGLGKDGSIAREEPSAKRLALVEREALELALYTFRYVPDVDHVVAMLPPGPGSASAQASDTAQPLSADKPIPTMLFRPGDVRTMLAAPLAATFRGTTPRPATISQQEADGVRAFTADNVFNASVVPSQTGQGFLVLERPAATTPTDRLLRSAMPKGG